MFHKILIANRGEIACRIIRTARQMGIETVAVFSEADSHAQHVRMADQGVCIGPAPATESYLLTDRIIKAAQETGAQAIHPGYGFLSESEAFSQACADNGIVFVGPPASAIKAMGSKSAAKGLMANAGVPLTPGYHGQEQDPVFLKEQAQRIGYPVLIKASAGGGGKGMRRVDQPDDFEAALLACKREARNAFGDDHVLIEQYVLKPRHIEIQVFADQQGNCIHLFERDCSVQRRHQKVLEEAPAPGMTASLRDHMGQAAVDAARAVGYVGAGTVEFIADAQGHFYFMEMNTRLQVEHPVTEMITGVDLVQWQLQVAFGEPLPLTQDQLQISGHAIEARIYAEDPDHGFLPATGQLRSLRLPITSKTVRIDTGVVQGDAITPYYDPMIAKLIVWGADRESARRRLHGALASYRMLGINNNVGFLGRLVTSDSFVNADLDTALIEREAEHLFVPSPATPWQVWALVALAQLLLEQRQTDGCVAQGQDVPWEIRDGWRLNGASCRTMRLCQASHTMYVDVTPAADGWRLRIGDHDMDVRGQYREDHQLEALLGDRYVSTDVVLIDPYWHVFWEGRDLAVQVKTQADSGVEVQEDAGDLNSPMPGKIIALLAPVGVAVAAGAPLLVLEAMKMEHTIAAPTRGVVKAFHYAVGDQVSEGDLLAAFETIQTT
jgi:3-methylcrotonyl-CoA carboxylase alpha subunit